MAARGWKEEKMEMTADIYIWGFLGGDEDALKSTSGDCCIILSMLETTGLYTFF